MSTGWISITSEERELETFVLLQTTYSISVTASFSDLFDIDKLQKSYCSIIGGRLLKKSRPNKTPTMLYEAAAIQHSYE